MEKLVSLCKRRGFVFPGSDIYGGLANSWDYGPLGAQMKMNIKSDWWKRAVEMRDDMVGLDGAILMNPKVWEASGHVATFNDPLTECKHCHRRYRADESPFAEHWNEKTGFESAEALQCPSCGKSGVFADVSRFNLMFQTHIGSTSESGSQVYLRPETAQAIFVNFKNILNTSRKKLPFGIAQIGKAFRNEITPGNFIFRTLEFEQMEVEYFVEPNDWEQQFEAWNEWMGAWAEHIGLDMSRLHRLEVPAEELAHYSKRTVDFEFDFPFGKKELWGLAYRQDFDLHNHTEHSGEKLEYSDPDDNKRKIVPHVIEPSMGVDRTLLSLLVSAFREEEVDGDVRTVMKFVPHMAPYHVAVLPLMKKDGLSEKAREIFEYLQASFRCEYDESGSVGKRYRRQDEIGTPYCVTVDYDSLSDESVTVRDRDSMQQERISLTNLLDHLRKCMPYV